MAPAFDDAATARALARREGGETAERRRSRGEKAEKRLAREREFLGEVEDAVRRHLQINLSDMNSHAGQRCDVCAGFLCNRSSDEFRGQWMCNSLRALQRLGPLAHPEFDGGQRLGDVGLQPFDRVALLHFLLDAVHLTSLPRASIGPDGPVHLHYTRENSMNPEHQRWSNSVAVTFPLCAQRNPFFFNCTEFYAFSALVQLREMLNSRRYLGEVAQTLARQRSLGRATPKAIAQEAPAQARAAHLQGPASTTVAPPGRPYLALTSGGERRPRFRLINARCTPQYPTRLMYMCALCGSRFKRKLVCEVHVMDECLRDRSPRTRRSEAEGLILRERIPRSC